MSSCKSNCLDRLYRHRPEYLVTEDPQTHDQEGGATLMLSYNGILAHSVQAMQELIQKVEALEARLARNDACNADVVSKSSASWATLIHSPMLSRPT